MTYQYDLSIKWVNEIFLAWPKAPVLSTETAWLDYIWVGMSPIQAGSVEKIEAVDLAKKVSSVSCLYGINFIWSVRQGVLTKINCISIRQAQRSEGEYRKWSTSENDQHG